MGTTLLLTYVYADHYTYTLTHTSLQVITLWYRPVDILFGSQKYNKAADMWSVGCIFGELGTCAPIFPGADDPDQLVKIFKQLGA